MLGNISPLKRVFETRTPVRNEKADKNELQTGSGHTIRIRQEDGVERVELRDNESRLLLRFEPETGNAVISAPGGDLTFAAPTGHIDLVAGRGVRCLGGESILLRAGSAPSSTLRLEDRQAVLSSEQLAVASQQADIEVGTTTYTGSRLDAALDQIRWTATRAESVVDGLVERVKTAHRTVEGLQRLTAGRMRTLVRGAYHHHAEHSSITTEDDLKLDGRRILLG